MIIANVMTRNPIFVSPDMSVNDARALMTREKIGKLPVLDKNNRLVGIVTKKDLVKAGPSAATSLDMYEISYLLSKLKVETVMERNVLTVQQTEVVEEAARIMADSQVGCLPVMKGELLVGIITETDLFRTFVDMFGARHDGIRATFQVEEKPGMIAQVSKAIADANGNIVSLVTFDGDDMSQRRCTVKVTGVERSTFEEILRNSTLEIEDIR
ncbi:MAG: CBS domain-containing protein [Spirochaetaceae bacterium]|nr:CBS domain-containing protein [Spirochaetaceae bacterium]MBQ4331156.1 CBS domain-containing protein [Spirochaetaceae bacterium]MBQ7366659.1 CBS domain-containing protein [Spirochaetaceae bacterium]MBQ8385219.1 CBS domain-containing protein [Spirochaetaceae bacterium]MBQ8560420.1 CBS domain-containing protein [Spirochaetaceae bacterium]